MANILLVESYANLASLYRTILTEGGHNVLIASDSTNAINLARNFEIDLAIVDEGLAGRDEETLIRKLKNVQPHIRTIVCSFDECIPTKYYHLCDERFIKTADYTILQGKINKLTKDPVKH